LVEVDEVDEAEDGVPDVAAGVEEKVKLEHVGAGKAGWLAEQLAWGGGGPDVGRYIDEGTAEHLPAVEVQVEAAGIIGMFKVVGDDGAVVGAGKDGVFPVTFFDFVA
jgi:hypothetical protein